MSYVIGLDLGTGSVKGVVANKNGTIVGTESSDLILLNPERNHVEQNPDDWFDATIDILKKLVESHPELKDELEGISFSGQMHSLVLLDDADQVIRNAILWNDTRTTPQCEQIEKSFSERLYSITKNKALEGFTLPKILWVKQNEPENWDKVSSFLLPKDFLGFKMTGNKQIEYSDAAGTIMLDIQKHEWSPEIFKEFDIDMSIAPKLVESHSKIGHLSSDIQNQLGISKQVSVFSGGADNPSAALGAGITNKDQAMVSIGTSGVVLAFEPDAESDYDSYLHYFNHVIPDVYYSMGVTLAAGNSLSWYKETFADAESYDDLLADIDQIEPGSDGLLFAPYISGERTPYTDSQIRGTFLGMDMAHTRDHFTRAVLEGITFSLRDSLELMWSHATKDFKEIISVGGGTKNESWLQMQADIFNTPIVTLKTEEGPAMGATMLAAVGAGWFKDFKECADVFVQYDKRFEPNKDNVVIYDKVYSHYQEIYPTIKDLSHRMSGTD